MQHPYSHAFERKLPSVSELLEALQGIRNHGPFLAPSTATL